MSYKVIILLCLIGIVCTPSSAQDIKVLGKNSFENGGSSHDRYTLQSVMEGNKLALEYYDRYINVYQNTRRERLIGVVMMTGGGVMLRHGFGLFLMEDNGDGAFFYSGLVAFIVGSALVIASWRTKQHILDKAIDIYNTNPPDIGMQQSYLNLGLTANGVGVVYQF